MEGGDIRGVKDGKELGAIVRARRRALGITQEELAAMVGLTQRSLSLIERGESGARSSNLFHLCHALGLDLSVSAR